MPIVQFRVHPGVGCARIGNSEKTYHLASEFPYFLQEQFPKLRFKPKPRTHPKTFFSDNVASSATGNPVTYNIYDTTPAFQNRFKEAEGKIFPQAVRFRVFAYVYGAADNQWPQVVFEVTTEIANIEWKVNIANKKAQKAGAPDADPDENLTTTSTDLDTSNTTLLCKRLRPVASLPNLAYLFLERDDRNEELVTGRLHVIGNEGEFVGSSAPVGLWSDDWYDSAGDGLVEAIVRPKDGGAPLRALAGIPSEADLKYLDHGVAALQAGSAEKVKAMPGWVVVGVPDYVPDMGHFVSLWDVGFSRAIESVEKRIVTAQAGKHKMIRTLGELNTYKYLDYNIHIHPQLCLFEDVRFVSGESVGDPEDRPKPPEGRAHNLHPGGSPPGPTEKDAMKHGGVVINARVNKADLEDPEKLGEANSSKPINTWLKRAVFNRLRKPKTVYSDRQFVIVLPTDPPGFDGLRRDGSFPRKLGRRMDYDKRSDGTFGPDKNKFYAFPNYEKHAGNLLKYHGLKDAGKLCGGKKSPPTAGPTGSSFDADDVTLLKWLDDMYWPATLADMPMLRELAYTPLQYEQFKVWQGASGDIRRKHVFEVLVASGLRRAFGEDREADHYFADFLAARPLYAPAMIDLAHLGAMLGGSFLPGIEVGREAGIAKNWCLFHGANIFFPSLRFKPTNNDAEHSLGTLTKDLAVPWSEDFKSCDELFWPTSRPGRTTKDGVTRQNWQIEDSDMIPHLGAKAANAVEFVKEYWKALGFIRRDASDKFVEQEQTWH